MVTTVPAICVAVPAPWMAEMRVAGSPQTGAAVTVIVREQPPVWGVASALVAVTVTV